MYKIYIVEDDATIARTLKEHLEKWDYQVQCTKDFRNITEEFARFSPELVLMDILLPFYNGYHWCTQIRKISRVPILFLSSAGDNMNIVMAMNMGGDDFVEKPFDLNELTARACGLPVTAGPVEATALGNVLAQMMGAGEIASREAARALVRESFPIDIVTPQGDPKEV